MICDGALCFVLMHGAGLGIISWVWGYSHYCRWMSSFFFGSPVRTVSIRRTPERRTRPYTCQASITNHIAFLFAMFPIKSASNNNKSTLRIPSLHKKNATPTIPIIIKKRGNTAPIPTLILSANYRVHDSGNNHDNQIAGALFAALRRSVEWTSLLWS